MKLRCDPAVILSLGSDNNVLLAEMRICRSTATDMGNLESKEGGDLIRYAAEEWMGTPEELGFAIATVADERNGYLTGVDILCDGGSTDGKKEFKRMIAKCLEHKECKKMVYVSSTGAIPEQPKGTAIRETDHFTPINEKTQVGCYSQSKAMATQEVLDACKSMGLKACVVHPSGILGPEDYAVSETTGTIIKNYER